MKTSFLSDQMLHWESSAGVTTAGGSPLAFGQHCANVNFTGTGLAKEKQRVETKLLSSVQLLNGNDLHLHNVFHPEISPGTLQMTEAALSLQGLWRKTPLDLVT